MSHSEISTYDAWHDPDGNGWSLSYRWNTRSYGSIGDLFYMQGTTSETTEFKGISLFNTTSGSFSELYINNSITPSTNGNNAIVGGGPGGLTISFLTSDPTTGITQGEIWVYSIHNGTTWELYDDSDNNSNPYIQSGLSDLSYGTAPYVTTNGYILFPDFIFYTNWNRVIMTSGDITLDGMAFVSDINSDNYVHLRVQKNGLDSQIVTFSTFDGQTRIIGDTEDISSLDRISSKIFWLFKCAGNFGWANWPILYHLMPKPDIDNDGICDRFDNDKDGDGFVNQNDDFPLDKSEWNDSDSDGIGDNQDLDDDNDGWNDSEDDFPLDPSEWVDTRW